VILTGYSLGGAVAALYLLEDGESLLDSGIDVRCVTFGCPRFVDQQDVVKLSPLLTSHIMHAYVEGDPIPLNLTEMLGGKHYCHVGNSMTIKDNGEGISLHEEGGLGNGDAHVKWWGLKPPSGWNSHFTSTYDRNLKMAEDKLLLKQHGKAKQMVKKRWVMAGGTCLENTNG
jgi:hypothetical protein